MGKIEGVRQEGGKRKVFKSERVALGLDAVSLSIVIPPEDPGHRCVVLSDSDGRGLASFVLPYKQMTQCFRAGLAKLETGSLKKTNKKGK